MLKSLVEKRLMVAKEVKVVSFDVFDTLLLRMVPSERVTELAARYMCKRWNELSSAQINYERVLASRARFKASHESQFIFREGQWTVSRWLDCLAKEFGFDEDVFQRIGRCAEVNAECLSVRLTKNAVPLVNSLKEEGFCCIAVSDTWIDQAWLKELLEKFELYFDEVYSSGSACVSKRRGTLYRLIQRRYGLAPEAFLHSGDNFQSDFIPPRLLGWRALWVPKQHQYSSTILPATIRRRFPIREIDKEILQALDAPPPPKNSDPYYRLAYTNLAPLLIIFSIVQWRRFREQNIEAVFYIARDALIMMEVYNLLSDLLPQSCPRHYVRLARRSVTLAHPDDLLQNVIPIAGKRGRKTVGEWLSNFGLDERVQLNILENAGLGSHSVFNEFSRYRLITACRGLPEICEEQSGRRRLLKDYLFQQSSRTQLKRIGIVDSGWACTIQDTIRGTLTESEVISGVYLGVSAEGHIPNMRNTKYGLLRDDFRHCRNPVEALAGVIRLWETLLREPAGTATGLQRRIDGVVEPILSQAQILSPMEIRAASSIRQGVLDGSAIRRKSVSLLVEFSDCWSELAMETAAAKIARCITTRPDRQTAYALLRLTYDEGAESNRKASYSWSGVKKGVAWYPGLLACYGLGWSNSALEKTVGIMLKRQLRERRRLRHCN